MPAGWCPGETEFFQLMMTWREGVTAHREARVLLRYPASQEMWQFQQRLSVVQAADSCKMPQLVPQSRRRRGD